MGIPDRRKRGRPEQRFMHVVREDIQMVVYQRRMPGMGRVKRLYSKKIMVNILALGPGGHYITVL